MRHCFSSVKHLWRLLLETLYGYGDNGVIPQLGISTLEFPKMQLFSLLPDKNRYVRSGKLVVVVRYNIL